MLNARHLKQGLMGLVGLSLLVSAVFWFWPRPRFNLLIITLDTVRADRLGCYGYQPALTPALDALAKQGVMFEHAYATAPVTLPSHATMFTGLNPAEHGLRTNGRGQLGKSVPTLAEIVQQHGYDTGAFVGSFVLDSKFGLQRGFNVYDDQLEGAETHGKGHHRERAGQLVVDSALAWLNHSRERPFCCWVHLYDAHFPYQAHEDLFGNRFSNEPYDAEIGYLDLQIGRLLDHLKSNNLERNTFVVVVGDHGEGLGDHHERRHGGLLYDTTLRVPLILKNPSRALADRRIDQRVSLVDLFPTVLDGLQIPHRTSVSGRSVYAACRGEAVSPTPCYAVTDEPFLEMGWSPLRTLIVDRWKYIQTPQPELYDLQADPAETRNLVESQPDEFHRMAEQLVEVESHMVARESAQLVLSPQERRVLESLGYAGGSNRGASGQKTESLLDMKEMLVYWNAIDDAVQFREHDQLDAAIERLEFVIQGAPSTVLAYVYLGNVQEMKGNASQAEVAYRTALQHDPECALAHSYLGDLALRQGSVDEAAKEYSVAIKSNPSSAETHFKLGNLFQQKGDMPAAQSHFQSAIEIDPRYTEAHTNLGNILAWQGQLSEAERQYREALRNAPDAVDANLNLATVLAAAGRQQDAETQLLKALRLKPNHPALQKKLEELRGHPKPGRPSE